MLSGATNSKERGYPIGFLSILEQANNHLYTLTNLSSEFEQNQFYPDKLPEIVSKAIEPALDLLPNLVRIKNLQEREKPQNTSLPYELTSIFTGTVGDRRIILGVQPASEIANVKLRKFRDVQYEALCSVNVTFVSAERQLPSVYYCEPPVYWFVNNGKTTIPDGLKESQQELAIEAVTLASIENHNNYPLLCTFRRGTGTNYGLFPLSQILDFRSSTIDFYTVSGKKLEPVKQSPINTSTSLRGLRPITTQITWQDWKQYLEKVDIKDLMKQAFAVSALRITQLSNRVISSIEDALVNTNQFRTLPQDSTFRLRKLNQLLWIGAATPSWMVKMLSISNR